MRKRGERETDRQTLDRDEFQAYGEYSYAFLHENDPAGSEEEPSAPVPSPAEVVQTVRRAKKRRQTSGFFKLLAVLTALSVLLIVLLETIFRLETVYVLGNKEKTPQQVVLASGLTKGVNIFSIRQEDVAKAMESDHTIELKGMQIEYPNTVYLYIEERKTVAVMRWLGNQYELDGEGMVMSESGNMQLPEGIPLITGFRVTSARVGQPLAVRSQKQAQVYRDLMVELDLQLCRDQVSEINLSTTDNYYLITKEGVTVRLGDGNYIRAKVGAWRTYVAYLRQLGKTSGMLDVSIPEDAKFLPED